MATITKPMALDETLHTTESTPRRQADVLAGIQQAIREGFGQVASGIEYDNTTSGLTSDNVQGAIDEVDAALDVVEDDIESTQELTGNPLTLTDAAPINAEKLEVVMEPKQDLHGQSYPYVGGAGKNKLPLTVDGIKAANTAGAWNGNIYTFRNIAFTILTDNDGNVTGINANGTNNNSSAANLILFEDLSNSCPFIDYELNGCPTGGGNNIYYIRLSDLVTSSVSDYGTGSTTIRVTATGKWRASIEISPNVQVTNKVFYPMISSDGGAFAPYTNICPISGYDSVSVDDVGANQWDEEWEVGGINEANGSETSNRSYIRSGFIPLRGSMSIYGYSRVGSQLVAYFYTSDKVYIGFKVITNISYTVPSNTAFCRIRIEVDITNYTRGDISINYPSTDHDYHPYQSTTASVTFGQTVYGGKSDFVNGGTKKTLGFKTFDGTENWDDSNSNGFKITVTDSGMTDAKDHAKCISNLYKYGSSVWTAGCFGIASVTRTLWVENATSQRFANLAAFKAYLAEHPLQVCYELATPTTIFTLPTDLKLLENINNISTDGTTINLGYQQNNVVGELKGEIEQAFYNHAMIYNIQSELADLNMAYTDDYMGVGFDVPFIQEQYDYSTTPPTNWNTDLSACDIAVNGIIPLYKDAQADVHLQSSKLIASIEQVQKKDDCFRVFVGFYNLKMTSAADNITTAFLILDITAFGKVIDLRTIYN